MHTIRVILADDHAVLRQGTCELLGREEDIRVVGEASNGLEALQMAKDLRPHVVIMDIRMPGLSGVEATRRIRMEIPQVQVLALTAHDDDQYVFALLKAGASGYLMKTSPVSEVVKGIREVYAGRSVLDSVIAKKVVLQMNTGQTLAELADEVKPGCEGLTARELEVLQLLAQGKSNKDIAKNLVISRRTVQTHMSNIFAKMEVSSRTEAVLTALRKGWLTV